MCCIGGSVVKAVRDAVETIEDAMLVSFDQCRIVGITSLWFTALLLSPSGRIK